ncbi:hypothetical protein CPB85DRAFT_435713 [Mucidula mucida]|nr:hypothetical protein CPB85DRAFT_435713 [Mucidula mucida]
MFVANFSWRSVYLVLQAGEWEDFKLGILHVGRVANAFLLEAREEAGQNGIGKMWRSEMFNRVLVRYRMGWLISDPKQLKEFWDLYGENEYRKDTIKTLEWTRIALKGHKGFSITEEQIEDGISIAQFMDGLKENEGKWLWDPSGQNSPGTSAYQWLEQWRATRTWRAGQVPSTGAAITTASKQDTAMAPPPPRAPQKCRGRYRGRYRYRGRCREYRATVGRAGSTVRTVAATRKTLLILDDFCQRIPHPLESRCSWGRGRWRKLGCGCGTVHAR